MSRYGRMKPIAITAEPMFLAILFGGLFTPVPRTLFVVGVVSNGGGAMVVGISALLRGLHDNEIDGDDHQADPEVDHRESGGHTGAERCLVLEDQGRGGA